MKLVAVTGQLALLCSLAQAQSPEACLLASMKVSAGTFKGSGQKLTKDGSLEPYSLNYQVEFHDRSALTYTMNGAKAGKWSVRAGAYFVQLYGEANKKSDDIEYSVQFTCSSDPTQSTFHIDERWELRDAQQRGKKWVFRQRRSVTAGGVQSVTEAKDPQSNLPFIVVNSYTATRSPAGK